MSTTQRPVAIVTGASSGIGLGVAQALFGRGWRVVRTSRTISSSKNLTPSPDLVLLGEMWAEGKPPAGNFLAPEWVVLRWVGIDCLMDPTMDGEI
jgi:NAD(P)-dependent dehydrogenase (short-subunit alcohol dehydrogenase family)